MAISDALCVQELSGDHSEAFFFFFLEASLVIIVTLGMEGNGVIQSCSALHHFFYLL